MGIREYTHPREGSWRCTEKYLSYKNSSILVIQRYDTDVMNIMAGGPQAFVIVPGRILSREENISRVEPVTDSRERDELTSIIKKENFKGPVNFW